MGTPEFAVPSLETLLENGYHVVAVITAPDRPKGRGQRVAASPVKECALKYRIPVLQPTNLKSPEFIETLKTYRADLQIVVAFRMLPEVVWRMPPLGTFNLHASLLPRYRGAAPINWAIIEGEKETGVTTFFLKHEIDTGTIIFREREPIGDHDTAGDLYVRLMNRGARLVLKTAKAIEQGNYPQTAQPESPDVRKAPKIFRAMCEVDWKKPTQEIYNFIRGLAPYPAAWTTLAGKNLKIYGARPYNSGVEKGIAGEYETDHKTYLRFYTADGKLEITELQTEGKKKMSIEEFLKGNRL